MTAESDCSHEIKRCLLLGRKAMTNLDNIFKSRDITLPTKVHIVKAMIFPVIMYGCESWTIKKAECWRIDAFWTVVLENTLESLLDSKEINLVNCKGNQFWTFIWRKDAEAEALILWPPEVKSQLTGKDSDAGKDWGRGQKGTTEDEMDWLNGHEFEQTPGDGEGQGSLACCSPWGCRVRHDWATEQQKQCEEWNPGPYGGTGAVCPPLLDAVSQRLLHFTVPLAVCELSFPKSSLYWQRF